MQMHKIKIFIEVIIDDLCLNLFYCSSKAEMRLTKHWLN